MLTNPGWLVLTILLAIATFTVLGLAMRELVRSAPAPEPLVANPVQRPTLVALTQGATEEAPEAAAARLEGLYRRSHERGELYRRQQRAITARKAV